MANLTSQEIKDRIDLIDWPSNSLPVFRVFKNIQTEGRQRFPRIDIENKSKQNTKKDVLLSSKEQRVLIHVFFRIKGSASDEEDKVGQTETLIADQLTTWILNGVKINIENFEWDRQTKLQPVRHIHSILTIFVSDIVSQSGSGVTGKSTTMDIGTISGLQSLGETGNQGRDSIRKWNTFGVPNNISGGKLGTRFFEYEYTKATFDTFDALIEAKAYTTTTIHEVGQADTVLLAKPTLQSHAVRYDGLKTVTVTLELK